MEATASDQTVKRAHAFWPRSRGMSLGVDRDELVEALLEALVRPVALLLLGGFVGQPTPATAMPHPRTDGFVATLAEMAFTLHRRRARTGLAPCESRRRLQGERHDALAPCAVRLPPEPALQQSRPLGHPSEARDLLAAGTRPE